MILPADWQSAFNVASSIEQFFGGFLCSWLADRAGRKRSLLCGVIVCTGGAFGEIFATTRAAFLVSKLILGVGLGFYLTLSPLMCSEIAPAVLRGLSTAGVNLGNMYWPALFQQSSRDSASGLIGGYTLAPLQYSYSSRSSYLLGCPSPPSRLGI
jgi:MFS family permease